ncbi:MAG: type 4b pilus protein PilO2 [Pseudomonadota bacterium]
MSLYITQIGKQKFVCGLFWQSLSRPRELLQEARQLAGKIDADMLVLRKDQTMAQAGYADSRDGARRGQCSLASVIAARLSAEGANYDGQQQPVHNWLGAFKLPDGMWAYCAVRDANFLPNGDFAGTKEEVLDRLHGDYGLGGWNVVVGDDELEEQGFHNFHPRSLDQLLTFKKGGQPKVPETSLLRPVKTQISRTALAGGAVALLLLLGVAWFWKQQAARRDHEQREQAMLAAQRALAGKTQVLAPPWEKMALVRDAIRICGEQLQLISPGGWELEQYICTPGNANYFWKRGNSNLAFLLEQVPQAVVQANGERAIHTILLSMPSGRNDSLLGIDQVLHPLLAGLQRLGLKAEVTPLQVNAAAAPGALPGTLPPSLGGALPHAPDWKTFSVKVALGPLAPREVVELFDRPGVRLDKFTYHAGLWSVEGLIYAK